MLKTINAVILGTMLCSFIPHVEATRISWDYYKHERQALSAAETEEEWSHPDLSHSTKICATFEDEVKKDFAWHPLDLKKTRSLYPSGIYSVTTSYTYPESLAYFGLKGTPHTMTAFFMPHDNPTVDISVFDEAREDVLHALERARQYVLFPHKHRSSIDCIFIPHNLLHALQIDYDPWIMKRINTKFTELRNQMHPVLEIYKTCAYLGRCYPVRALIMEMLDHVLPFDQLIGSLSGGKSQVMQDFFGPDLHKANVAALVLDRADRWANISIDLTKRDLSEQRMIAYYHHAMLNPVPFMIVSGPEREPFASAWYIKGEKYRAERETRYLTQEEMLTQHNDIYKNMRSVFFYDRSMENRVPVQYLSHEWNG